jgi:RimJ/RimL family protein N-acetyltransferase
VEGTARWLKNQVIETPDRLLFMIRVDGRYMGHVGLFRFHFDQRECEIDNIVRGEDDFPGIMGEAIGRMMDWGKAELGLEKYGLVTFSDNQKSLHLYRRLDFVEVRRVPLQRVEKEDRVEWVETPGEYFPKIERYNVYMELSGKGKC